ncbi:hypothetical protein Taro_037836, partial [Colocasia esculenta]|nr:hypothetical protein [Colocasia esculenta]
MKVLFLTKMAICPLHYQAVRATFAFQLFCNMGTSRNAFSSRMRRVLDKFVTRVIEQQHQGAVTPPLFVYFSAFCRRQGSAPTCCGRPEDFHSESIQAEMVHPDWLEKNKGGYYHGGGEPVREGRACTQQTRKEATESVMFAGTLRS